MKMNFADSQSGAAPAIFGRSRIVQVAKCGGTAFLDATDKIWRARDILMIGAASGQQLPVTQFIDPAAGGGWWRGAFEPDHSDDLAQISITSGTTGQPKAIAISRRAISDTVERLVCEMEIDASIREYIGVPVTFSFGLGRARAVAAADGAAFLPQAGFRPDEIAAMLQAGEINALSAVPSMLRTILANPQIIGGAGAELRWLEIGSQYMSADEKRAVRALFPAAIILQHYGLTEASRSTFLRIDTADDDVLESVGRPVGDGKVRIGADGQIEIAGSHLASGTISGNRLHELSSDDGWLRTTDLGELRDGWLHYLGRNDDVANIGGVKVSAELFENQLKARLPEQVQLAVCAIHDDLRGEKLAIVFAAEDDRRRFAAFSRALAPEYGLRPLDVIDIAIDDFPVTETGKIRRKTLAATIEKMAAEGMVSSQIAEAAAASPSDELTPREAEIAAIWADALGVATVGRHDSFHDLGGDSLSAVSVMINAGQAGLSADIMQRMFSGDTVAQIAAALDGNDVRPRRRVDIRSIRADALNAVRGLFALLIVVSHWGPFFVERMGRNAAELWAIAAPALRIGTPGFAMVYGMGLGLFFFGQLDRGQDRIRRRMRTNTLLLFGGVTMVAAAQAMSLLATDAGFGPIWPEQLFYGVLLFYLLMVATSLFWLRLIARSKRPISASLLLALTSYGVYGICASIFPVNPFTGWASLGWHMAVAPYAYPRLLGAAALGLAVALWIQRENDIGRSVGLAAGGGFGLAISGALSIFLLGGDWYNRAGELWAIPLFLGVLLLLYAAASAIAAADRQPMLLRLAITCGMLAFPIFIGHGLVLPIKEVLMASGMPTAIAIVAPVGLFFALMLWLGSRVYRMMFFAGERH